MTGLTLRCRGVSKRFGGNPVLADVTCSIDGPAIAAITGANGSGKTTLLDILGGLTRPDAGHCALAGIVLETLAPYQIARAGVARSFQVPRLFPSLTVVDNVSLAVQASTSTRREGVAVRARLALEECGVSAIAEERASALSYGEQKLVALASVLARAPRVALLDEPLSGLDGAHAQVAMNVVRRIAAANAIVMIVEHVSSVFDIATHRFQLQNGLLLRADTRGAA